MCKRFCKKNGIPKEEGWDHYNCDVCPNLITYYKEGNNFLFALGNAYLYEKEELLNTFLELLGYSETKPFECVGTYSEVRYAVSLTINNSSDKLPYLLSYYKNNFPLELDTNYKAQYNHYNYHNNQELYCY